MLHGCTVFPIAVLIAESKSCGVCQKQAGRISVAMHTIANAWAKKLENKEKMIKLRAIQDLSIICTERRCGGSVQSLQVKSAACNFSRPCITRICHKQNILRWRCKNEAETRKSRHLGRLTRKSCASRERKTRIVHIKKCNFGKRY